MSSSAFLVGSISLSISLLTFFFCSNLSLTLFSERLVCCMTDLEESNYFIHRHPVVIFLLLNKLVKMVSGKGVKENQVTFPFAYSQFKISLEVIVQLEENLEARLENIRGHIVRLL